MRLVVMMTGCVMDDGPLDENGLQRRGLQDALQNEGLRHTIANFAPAFDVCWDKREGIGSAIAGIMR